MATPSPSVSPRRATWFGIVAILSVSLVGFLRETGQPLQPRTPHAVPPAGGPAGASSVSRAKSYAELGQTRRGPNGNMYRNAFAALQGAPELFEARLVSEPERQAAIDGRSTRRAFAGAPPVIPHAVAQREPNDCLACHAAGARIAGRTAPVISHETFSNCLQCHAVGSKAGAGLAPPLRADEAELDPAPPTDFQGLRSYGLGDRAWPGAPPTIPHPTQMRSQCMSCHGPQGANGLRTPHPERQSCLQCHARRQPADAPPTL